jgi:hypothetical protein
MSIKSHKKNMLLIFIIYITKQKTMDALIEICFQYRLFSVFCKNQIINMKNPGSVNRFFFVLTTKNIFSPCSDVKYCVVWLKIIQTSLKSLIGVHLYCSWKYFFLISYRGKIKGLLPRGKPCALVCYKNYQNRTILYWSLFQNFTNFLSI